MPAVSSSSRPRWARLVPGSLRPERGSSILQPRPSPDRLCDNPRRGSRSFSTTGEEESTRRGRSRAEKSSRLGRKIEPVPPFIPGAIVIDQLGVAQPRQVKEDNGCRDAPVAVSDRALVLLQTVLP